jgi:pyruvate carboxylase subunit B
MRYVTIINDKQYEIDIDKDGNVVVNGQRRHVDFLTLEGGLYSVITETRSLEVVVEDGKNKQSVQIGGRMYEAQVLDERALLMAMRKGTFGSSSGEVIAPMPGLIVAVQVAPGETVAQGQTVIILESMKMQNELKAPVAGIINAVSVNPGQTVDKDQVLITIDPPPAENNDS